MTASVRIHRYLSNVSMLSVVLYKKGDVKVRHVYYCRWRHDFTSTVRVDSEAGCIGHCFSDGADIIIGIY